MFSLDVDMDEFTSAEFTLQVMCESRNHFHIMADLQPLDNVAQVTFVKQDILLES